jgi:selenocysteine-specific elongation factor
LLEGESLEPGRDALAQIRLEAPVVADRGDRFVLRSYSPARALAGGKVILPVAPKRRRGHGPALDEIRREETGSVEERVLAALDGIPNGAGALDIARAAGMPAAAAEIGLDALVKDGRAVRIQGDLLVSASVLRGLAQGASAVLRQLQRDNPLRWGTSRGELKSRLGVKLLPAVFERVLQDLTEAGEVAARDDHLRLGQESQVLPPEMQVRVDRVTEALDRAGVTPPSMKELQAQLGYPVQDILEHLTFRGEAAKVTPELYLHRLHLRRIVDWLAGFFAGKDDLNVADLREGLGMSRKYSVPILEFLDRQGWTRRIGDVRQAGRRWQAPSDS